MFNCNVADFLTTAGLITPVAAPALPTPYYHQSLSPLSEHPPTVAAAAPSVEYSPAGKPAIVVSTGRPHEHEPKRPQPPPIDDDAGGHICRHGDTYATSFWRQLSLLILRTFLNMWRDKSLTAMRLFIHCSIALLIGTLYVGIGNDASNVFNIFRYIFFSIMFTMFTAFSSMQLVCKCKRSCSPRAPWFIRNSPFRIVSNAVPLELPIVTREHFNRWYSLRAYYTALTLADAPVQAACIFIYTVITYLMTSQPLEFFRFGLFFGVVLMTAFVAQSLGLVVGALFSVKVRINNESRVGEWFTRQAQSKPIFARSVAGAFVVFNLSV